MDPTARLQTLGLVLPAQTRGPGGVRLPFPWVHVVGNRLLFSGHGPVDADGELAGPFGKVGAEVTPEAAYASARRTALAVLGSIERAIGSLDRVRTWVRVFGMVNAAPGFVQLPAVINGFSDLVIEVYGAERGRHARSAVGMAELPFGIPVEVEGEVEIAP